MWVMVLLEQWNSDVLQSLDRLCWVNVWVLCMIWYVLVMCCVVVFQIMMCLYCGLQLLRLWLWLVFLFIWWKVSLCRWLSFSSSGELVVQVVSRICLLLVVWFSWVVVVILVVICEGGIGVVSGLGFVYVVVLLVVLLWFSVYSVWCIVSSCVFGLLFLFSCIGLLMFSCSGWL